MRKFLFPKRLLHRLFLPFADTFGAQSLVAPASCRLFSLIRNNAGCPSFAACAKGIRSTVASPHLLREQTLPALPRFFAGFFVGFGGVGGFA